MNSPFTVLHATTQWNNHWKTQRNRTKPRFWGHQDTRWETQTCVQTRQWSNTALWTVPVSMPFLCKYKEFSKTTNRLIQHAQRKSGHASNGQWQRITIQNCKEPRSPKFECILYTNSHFRAGWTALHAISTTASPFSSQYKVKFKSKYSNRRSIWRRSGFFCGFVWNLSRYNFVFWNFFCLLSALFCFAFAQAYACGSELLLISAALCLSAEKARKKWHR